MRDLISLIAALAAVSLFVWGIDWLRRGFEEFVADLESEGTKPVTGKWGGEESPNAATGFSDSIQERTPCSERPLGSAK